MFVDDEPHILRMLGRVLRTRDEQWDMEFVSDAGQAIDALARQQADVVVTDVTMPSVDGITLLQQVREEHPNTVRVVLSGTIEGATAVRAVPVAHQFLAKPWRPAELIELIERALSLRELLDSDVLRAIVGRMGSLPSIPAVFQQLSSMLEDPRFDLHDIADTVGADPGIAARVLQLARSPFFGCGGRIETIRDAAEVLGTATIRNLVLASEVFRMFEEKRAPDGFSLPRVQRHALTTASIAAAIIPSRRGEAYTAGLLHDIGELILAAELPEQWVTIAALAATDDRPSEEIELEQIGATHAEIGAYLLGLWGLPREIVEAVAYHDQPRHAGASSFDLVGAVHVAEQLAREMAGEASRLDIDWLEEIGAADCLDTWRAQVGERLSAP